MTVDRGHDFPQYAQEKLDSYGAGMWRFRDGAQGTTKGLNLYQGDLRRCVASAPQNHSNSMSKGLSTYRPRFKSHPKTLHRSISLPTYISCAHPLESSP